MTPPLAPTITYPANGAVWDAANSFTVVFGYNPDAGSGPINGIAFRVKPVGGVYRYWNGTDCSSTVPVWVAQDTSPGFIVAPGAMVNGTTYLWSIATREATSGGQGPFAADLTSVPQDSLMPMAPTIRWLQPTSYWDVVANSFLLYWNPNLATGSGWQEAFALRVKTATGPYFYWNGNDFSSTSPQWVPIAQGFSNVTIPANLLVNGQVYSWSIASQENTHHAQGPFAADMSFTSRSNCTATITGPTGTITTTSPTITWALTVGVGQSQTGHRVWITDRNTAIVWDTGVQTSGDSQVKMPGGILVNGNYTANMTMTETDGQTSILATRAFTVAVTMLATPTAKVVASSSNGVPCLTVTVTGKDATLPPNVTLRISRGDGIVPRLVPATYTTPATQTAVFNDFELIPGVLYNYYVAIVSTAANGAVTNSYVSDTKATPVSVTLTRWDISDAQATYLLPIYRASYVSGTVASGGQASLVVGQTEKLGAFTTLGRTSYIITHGDMIDEEFDLALVFTNQADWNTFNLLRGLQQPLQIRTDLGELYWINFGPDRPGIILRGDRTVPTGPLRQVTVHCYPVDRP